MEEPAAPFFIFGEGFLVASPFSRALWERVRALGDRDFRDDLAPAVEETHLYLEVLGAAVTGLSFLGNFLAAVLLPTESKGELPPVTPALETDVGAAALPVGEAAGEDTELAGLGSTPPTFWLFTHVNLDFFKKDAPTWPWLL